MPFFFPIHRELSLSKNEESVVFGYSRAANVVFFYFFYPKVEALNHFFWQKWVLSFYEKNQE
jgi:hypothetical protein